MKIIPVLIFNLRGSHKEMADLHATTILYMNFRNIKGLLTEREVCTVKYQTEVFFKILGKVGQNMTPPPPPPPNIDGFATSLVVGIEYRL